MHGYDHIRLGIFLKNKYLLNVNGFHRFLFCLGNFAPDRWAPTYFKGFLKDGKLDGHKFENCRKRIVKILPSLGGKSKWGWLAFLRLGILCHFVADSFTFPHNVGFTGDLHDHVLYERELTEEWKKYFSSEVHFEEENIPLIRDYMRAFDRIHLRYTKLTPTVQNDRKTILYMNQLLLEYLLNRGIVLKYSRKYKKILNRAS